MASVRRFSISSVLPLALVLLALLLPTSALAQTGSISGTIAFEGVPGGSYPPIRVEARDPNQGDLSWGPIAWVDSNGDGTFSIEDLAPGQYRVYFNPLGTDRAFQWYPDGIVSSGGQVVTVTAGTDTPLATTTLRPGYRIQGEVTFSTPPADPTQIWIEAYEAASSEMVSTGALDPLGHYERTNLPAGRYVIRAWKGTTSYVPKYWPDSLYSGGATPVEVNASASEATANFTLAAGATVSGRVLLAGAPLQSASVNAWLQGTCCFDIWSQTDGDGRYVLAGLPQGTYRLRVQGATSPDNQPYAGQRWNGRSSFDAGDDLVVGAAGRDGIDFSLPAATRTIEGLVYLDANDSNTWDAGESKLSLGITVYRASDGACCEWSGSGGDGTYRIAVPEGQYKVEANPPSNLIREYWNNRFFLEDADVVDVTSVSATGIDLSLREGSSVGAGLDGRVVSSDGATGIGGVDVQLNRWSTGRGVASVRSGADGAFRFDSIPPGDYQVYFDTSNSNSVNDQDYVQEYWSRCQTDTCPEGVIDPNDRKVSYPARPRLGDFRLSAGGSISGTTCVGDEGVACPASDPELPGSLWINLESVVSSGPGGQNVPSVQVGPDGHYRIRGIPAPASYRVRASAWGTDFTSVYYASDTTSTPYWSLAIPVQVEIGSSQTARDLHLVRGGSISGHVYCGDGDGEAIPGMQVYANFNASGIWYGSGAQTDGSGYYVFGGLPPGDYQVSTGSRGQGSAGCPNAANQTYASMIPVVGTGSVSDVDFHLQPGTSVSGNVQYLVSGVPRPVVNMRVSASDYATGQYLSDGYTDSNGDYVVYGLPTGRDYRVQVESRDNSLDPLFWNFIQETYPNDYTGQGSPVSGGATGIDFVLELGGGISGRVTAAGAIPLTGLSVNAWLRDGNGPGGWAQTDQNGFYVIRGLPAARYVVYANPQPRNYVAEYYDNVAATSEWLATPVTVTQAPDSVTIVPNIDFELAAGVTIKGRVRFGGSPVTTSLRLAASGNGPLGGWSGEFTTGTNGEYEITGLVPGSWRVRVLTLGTSYAFQQKDVTVTASGLPCAQGDRSDCVDFDLAAGSTLNILAYEDKDLDGTCTSTDAAQGLGPSIQYWETGQNLSDSQWGSFQTDKDGIVSISGLPAGRFRVSLGGNGFVTQYFDSALRSSDADPLELASAQTRTATFCLIRGRTISGRAFYDRDGDGAQTRSVNPDFDEPGVANVCLGANSTDGSFSYWDCTDANGDYAITGVLPAYAGASVQYRVRSNAQGTPYASEYFDRVPDGSGPALGTFKRSLAEIVTVSGADRADVDFSLGLGGGVQGRVTEDGGEAAPLAGIRVYVNPVDGDSDGFGGTTDSAGQYLITGLAPGSYRLEARDQTNGIYVGEYYDNTFSSSEATPVPVAARATKDDPLASTANFALAKGGTIEGLVYEDKDNDGSFTPAVDGVLSGVSVTAERSASPSWWLTSVGTQSDGTFRLTGIPPGLGVRVRAGTLSGTDLISVYYDGTVNGDQGTVNASQATSVTVPAPGATVSGIRFAMVAGGSISGTVTDEQTGQPLSGLSVCANPATSGSGACQTTGPGGTYRIRGLMPGNYRVNAGGGSSYRFEYYLDTPDYNAATLVAVLTGQDRGSVDFALATGGRVSGDVTDGQGAPLAGISICAQNITPGLAGQCAGTDSLGHYLIRGLATGSFRLSASGGSSYRSEYYDNQTDSNAATPVVVTQGSERTGASFVLVQQPRILSGPTPATGVRGTTVTGVQLSIDRAAGGLCGASPCVRLSLGSDKLHVENATLAGGTLTFDLRIDADAPLGKLALSLVNDFSLEDGATVQASAFEVTVQDGAPAPSSGERVYVVEAATSRIHVYSSVDFSKVAPVAGDPSAPAIEVCCQPNDIVLSPDKQLAYVLGGDRAIGIVDLRLGREGGRIAADTGLGFYGVAVTATHVYVAERRLNDRILVFDAKTGTKVTEIMLGVGALPWGLRLHPGGRYLYAAVRGPSPTPPSVTVVDTTTDTVTSTVPVPAGVVPRGFAFRPGGASGFLQAQIGTYLLDTTNPASPTLVGTNPILNTRSASNGVIEVAATGGKLLAHILVAGPRLWIADVTTDAPVVLANLTLGVNATRLAVTADGTRVFVAHGGSQDVYAVDVAALLANPALVPASRIAGFVVPSAVATGPIPATPAASRPLVTGVTPSTATNGGSAIAVTVTGSNFASDAVVWLKDTIVRGTVTSASSTSLSVTFPATTPAGTHAVVVTNPATNESGLDPAVALRVDPPAYVHTQTVFNASFGTAGIDVFAPDGSRDFIATEPLPAAIAVTPDGRLGLVNHTYTGPVSVAGQIASQDYDTALFDLDPDSATFRTVVATLPYVFGGYEPAVFTPDIANPNGVWGYVPNWGVTDTVSLIDPATRTEIDTDENPATQSYPVDDPYMGAYGQKLPGLNRIHLEAQVTDGALWPQGVALTPDGSLLYVSSIGYPGDSSVPGEAARVSILNTVNGQVIGELTKAGNGALTDANSIAIPPSGGHVFVTGLDGASSPAPALFVYRTGETDNDAAFVDRVPLDEVPRGMAVSKDGRTVYVALRFSGLLQAIDVTPKDGGGVVGTKQNVVIGSGPVRGVAFATIAYDDSLLYVTNNFRGEIYVLDISTTPMNPTLVTTLGARCASTIAVQPATGNPRLDSVTPPTGPAIGGNTVALMGANFSVASQVRFGAIPAAAVVVDSAFRIRVQAPGGSGTVAVTVENPDGATAALPSAYTYVADTTPPVFTTPLYVGSESLVGSSGSETVSVVLKWTTDEDATTVLDYGIGSLSNTTTVPGFGTSHVVTLTGLTPGATYLFRATSVDRSANSDSNPTPALGRTLVSVPDTTPPVMTDLDHSVTETTATIVWKTNEEATSHVQFDGTVDGNLTQPTQPQDPTTRQSHSVTLTGLQRNKTYEYRVRSVDGSGNGTTAPTAPPYRTFTTACELVPPVISEIAVSYLSRDLVLLSWKTDELSTSFVNFGTSSLNEQGVMDVSPVTQHVVFLTRLLPNQCYGFQVGSTDACGNTAASGDPFAGGNTPCPAAQSQSGSATQGLTTQKLASPLRLGVATLSAGTMLSLAPAAPGFQTPEAEDTTGPQVTTPAVVTVLGSDRVRITVGTDEAASLLASYGVNHASEASAFDPTFTQTPSLILAGLLASTTYQLQLVLTDPKGNLTTVAGLAFQTPAEPDTTAPVLSNVVVSGLTETSATVSWTTSEPAESWVRFGVQGGGFTGTTSAPGVNANHSVVLTGLQPGTSYAFEANSRDGSDNVGTTTGSFQTAYASPTINSLTPDRAAQGATLSVIVNGAHFAVNAVVGLGPDVIVNSSSVSAGGTQLVASVTIGASASWGSRLLRVTNPQSGLSAEAPFTIVDTSVPVITILEPLSGAEIVTPSVTVRGTVSESVQALTVNGVSVVSTGASPPFGFRTTLSFAAPGAHSINVTAMDLSGNRASSSIDVKYMTLSVDDAAVVEGDDGSRQVLFNLNLPTPSANAITVQYATSGGSATPGVDYVSASGSATVPAGYLSYPVAVSVNGDRVDEDDETFTLTLSNASGAAIVDGQATATIRDDDAPPVISISDAPAVSEGNSGTVAATLTVTLSNPSSKAVTVSYATGGGTATAGSDYDASSGTLSFAPLDGTPKSITVAVRGDLVDEPDESLIVTLANPSNATLGDGQGQITILDDDIGASLAVSDASVTEGDRGMRHAAFTVALSSPATVKVRVRYATRHVTTTNQDLDPTSGQLLFQPGQTAKTVAVLVKGDTLDEEDESFLLRLGDAEGVPIGDAEGVGTIVDDDPRPALSIADVSVYEGNRGATTASFVVTLSARSGRTVSVSYSTRDGTASAGSDYTAAIGSVSFAPGETFKVIPVRVVGDKTREANERLYVDLSAASNATLARASAAGTIRNDD